MTKAMTLLSLFTLLTLTKGVYGAVYGEDERKIITINSPYHHLSKSILSQLREGTLHQKYGRNYLETKTLNEHVGNLCQDTPFRSSPTFSYCTAFMVSSNLMVTAGHCINNQKECEEATWAFTSAIDFSSPNPEVPERDIVKCEKIISRMKNSISKNDYALLKVTKEVNHRPFLEFRSQERVPTDSKLVVIGHPTGLPLISTDQGSIIENDSDFLFKITSDTFGGNSGSPVINLETGLVEGILTDGDFDYTLNKARKCLTTYKCAKEGQCKGENVVRITNIPQLVPGMTPKEPIFDPRFPRL